MLVFKTWDCHILQRQNTLQIPVLSLSFDGTYEEEVDLPDEWFMKLTYQHAPAAGKQLGYLHLSPAGWKANKDRFKKQLTKKQFEMLQQAARKLFAEVKEQKRKKLAYHQAMIKDLQKCPV